MTVKQLTQAANFLSDLDPETKIQLLVLHTSNTVRIWVNTVYYIIDPNGNWKCYLSFNGRKIDEGVYECDSQQL